MAFINANTKQHFLKTLVIHEKCPAASMRVKETLSSFYSFQIDSGRPADKIICVAPDKARVSTEYVTAQFEHKNARSKILEIDLARLNLDSTAEFRLNKQQCANDTARGSAC